jgi:hypothetical protein
MSEQRARTPSAESPILTETLALGRRSAQGLRSQPPGPLRVVASTAADLAVAPPTGAQPLPA